ncbi:MAG: ABC transporter ATP-binding protein [Ruminococcus sp.]|nr:ABC transporter ATP-binding protein [Ruminococcus sp.]
MIQVKNASFKYENAISGAAVEDIHAVIPKGEVVLLCGESGSGKTTFSRLINGLIPSYYEGELEGTVLVEGQDIQEVELYELAPHVGSVFQNPKSQFYTLQTDTEIVFACENIGMEKADILKRFDITVESLHIQNLLGKSLFALSGGEKQKIACASVSSLLPEIFVLDEPSSNLDIGTIQELQKILLSWKAQGKTIIIAEHRLAWLRSIADRVLFFKNGKIALDLASDSFWEKTTAEIHNMGLRAHSRFYPEHKRKADSHEKIELRDFRFSYGKTPILNIPFLEVPEGAVVAVLGDNGAGKTTFARCLCGLEKKGQGTLMYKSAPYIGKKRINLCYMVMQDVNHQLFSESVLEEVVLGADIPTDEKKEKIAGKILSELDLLEYKDAHPMSLSGGQRQRVAIASAVASDKEIIVFDEPTSGLDYRHMKEVAENIHRLSSLGKTEFIITHDPELVAACCDYFVFIESGTVTHSGEWTSDNIQFVGDYFNLI